MSYNLLAEGPLDYDELADLAAQYPAVEVFPVVPERDGEPAGLGIAVPRGRAAAAAEPLAGLVRELLARRAAVTDLFTGAAIASDDDLRELVARVRGD